MLGYLKNYYYQYKLEQTSEFIFGIIMIIIGLILYYKTINLYYKTLSHSGFYRYIKDFIYYIKNKKGDNK